MKKKITPRQFGAETYFEIKGACRELVRAAGGAVHCASMTRTNQNRLSEAISPQFIERFMKVDQVADLEAECGDPIVTRHLAAMAGYDLTPRATATTQKAVLTEFAEMVSAVGAVEQNFALSFAEGKLDAGHAAQLAEAGERALKELHDLIATAKAAASGSGKLRVAQ
ncbi:phage regulatory CII family protein [Aestuariivirga litoralis]|uniref:phage regulatory CII family protein n=1 Tax=Aestuariivirga litoralis TaxID=2650924 RepID=UPI0018C522EF|nr:phage regulatory CII family protein [Aestuariivirga litoralis]MBG1232993.1 hypothetical protein [Aestuariivirga litoralis]